MMATASGISSSLAAGPTLAAGREPILDIPAAETVMDVINRYSVPEISLPFVIVPLFVLMLLFYRQWTKPVVFALLMVLFVAGYFGAMFVSYDYLQIIRKPDNVPITIMLLGLALCLWTAFREAAINDGRIREGKPLRAEGKDDKVLVWPDLVYTEMICILLASFALIVWSVLLKAPLESPANPAGPPNPSKAPWYFLGLQEMLVYYDPWMAGVLLPGLIVVGLIAMPYIDTNPKGNGYYTFAQRKFAITVWMFGFLILWVVLIVFGTFLRGPNWNFFGPFEYWNANRQVPLTNVNLSDYFWLWGLNKPLPTRDTHGGLYWLVRELPGILFVVFWIFGLPMVLAKTVMRRMVEQMGMPRFLVMASLLVVMAMLPLKMVLRWVVTLKYFVYLPEFNLNY